MFHVKHLLACSSAIYGWRVGIDKVHANIPHLHNPFKGFAEEISIEALGRFRIYESLLKKWNQSINLVSDSTLENLWKRHFQDSAQLLDCAPGAKKWVDVGSGGGFPGLVLTIIAAEREPNAEFTLIESSAKKCSFLRCVLRETGLRATILETRCEKAAPQGADAVTARALAPLPKLLALTTPHVAAKGMLIFPKGHNRNKEIVAAKENWKFHLQERKSITNASGAILIIKRAKLDRTAK